MIKFLLSLLPIPAIKSGQRFTLNGRFSTEESDVLVKSVTLGTVRFVAVKNGATGQQQSLPLQAFKMQYRLVKN